MDWIDFLWHSTTGNSRSLIFHFFSGECSGRTVLSDAGHSDREKRRRKSNQQGQGRREKGQENNRKEKIGTTEGQQEQREAGSGAQCRAIAHSKCLKKTSTEGNLCTDIYQGQFCNKEFEFALNVVVILKTNLATKTQAHVILFSTDLEQAYDTIISVTFHGQFQLRLGTTLQTTKS